MTPAELASELAVNPDDLPGICAALDIPLPGDAGFTTQQVLRISQFVTLQQSAARSSSVAVINTPPVESAEVPATPGNTDRTIDGVETDFAGSAAGPARRVDLDLSRQVFAERFDLLDELGEGGMGRVLRAFDRKLKRFVAVKRLKNPQGCDDEVLARFLHEAQFAAGLGHANIVTVHDILTDDEGPYLVLEYVDGESLADRLKKGAMPWDEAVELLLPVCDALIVAHARGIIHRDIKPHNILLTKNGPPKLADFGIARSLDGQGMTLTGAVLGTLDYIAPEQLSSAKTADEQSDVYSLGATLYHMVTGESPRRIRESMLPAELQPTVLKALENQPKDRHTSVFEFKQAMLEAGRGGDDGKPGAVGPATKSGSPGASEQPAKTNAPLLDLAERMAGAANSAGQLDRLARQAMGEFQFGQAVELLEQIPDKLRNQQLYREALAKRDRLLELEDAIRERVADHDFRKLALPVRQALELVPGRPDLLALLDQCPELRPGTKAGDRTLVDCRGLEIPFRWCPPGKFRMGSPNGERDRYDDENQVDVELTHGFWLGETVVTQELFAAILNDHPSHFKGPNRPVENVSWDKAQAFCKTLTKLLRAEGILAPGWQIGLPSEAQWEYACRAGTTTAFSFGNDAARLAQFAWFEDNSGGTTHPVATREPNPWGLFDMHGGVWEWCADWYDAKLGGGTNPPGASTGSIRVYRGGGWNRSPRNCRSARRYGHAPGNRFIILGFRLCLSSD